MQGLLAAEFGGRLFSYSYLSQGVALGPSTLALNRLLAFDAALVLGVILHFS